jgi:hypothetical protein
MKKLSVLLLAVCSIVTFGQKVSDYKYISIPAKFETFKEPFDLDISLTKALKGKKYMVLQADRDQWPLEAKVNSCSVLNADLKDDSGFLRNKVILEFKDCHGKVVQAIKGGSSIKDFKEGFNDALKQTFPGIPVSNPTELPVQAQTQTQTQETIVNNTQTFTTTASAADNNAVKFSNGKMDVQRIQIDNNQFILVNSNSSSPFATFKPTTKSDVFRVKLQNGDSTLGYFENGNIVIEIPQSNGEYAKEIFLKK